MKQPDVPPCSIFLKEPSMAPISQIFQILFNFHQHVHWVVVQDL